jgi:hypothetical protein
MDKLFIPPTDDSPEIILDQQNNRFQISGKSLPEDVGSFYSPIIEWLTEYASSPNENTALEFKLSYFNTASSKLILDILLVLEEMADNGKNVKVKWHYPVYDEDMRDAGIEYEEMVEVPFEHIQYGSDKNPG